MVERSVDIASLRKTPDLPQPPGRVVSLVPSITESLFDLGFGSSVVGITDYCVHPASEVEGIPRIGGTKDPMVSQIIDLSPDLIFANLEENTPTSIRSLVDAGQQVWVSFPTTVDEVLDDLRNILAIFHTDTSAPLVNSLQMAVDWARAAAQESSPVRYFCPIWYERSSHVADWWMTVNHKTYTHDLLSTFAGENVFAARERRYPLAADLGLEDPQEVKDRDTRYPRVTREEIISTDPELVLLPSEPFSFSIEDKLSFTRAFPNLQAVQNNRVVLLDGSLITWPGTRLAKAIREIPAILHHRKG